MDYSESISFKICFTIGHSTRALEEFVQMLKARDIARLIDVRTIPRSRMNPQFNRDTLPQALAAHGIAYEHDARLGGLRHARRDSPNTGWKNASFRGYADHMATGPFRAGIARLIEIVHIETACVMCAEAVPWRCHRSMIADALLVRGVPVEHIVGAKTEPHRLTSFARVTDGEITYPRETLDF